MIFGSWKVATKREREKTLKIEIYSKILIDKIWNFTDDWCNQREYVDTFSEIFIHNFQSYDFFRILNHVWSHWLIVFHLNWILEQIRNS